MQEFAVAADVLLAGGVREIENDAVERAAEVTGRRRVDARRRVINSRFARADETERPVVVIRSRRPVALALDPIGPGSNPSIAASSDESAATTVRFLLFV